MAHKDKILANLKTKHTKVQASVLEFIANKLDPKVTTEEDVETVIKAFEDGPITVADIALQIGKEGDKRVSDALKKQKDDPTKKDDPTQKDDPTKKDDTTKKDDSNPDPLAQVLKELQGMKAEITSLKTEKVVSSATEKLLARAKTEKIPAHLLPSITSEEEIDAAIETGKTRLGEVKQELANDGFSQVTPPGGSNVVVKGADGKVDAKAVAADVTGFVNKTLAAQGKPVQTEVKQ